MLIHLVALSISLIPHLWAIDPLLYQSQAKEGFVRSDGLIVHATETDYIVRSSLSLLDSADHYFVELNQSAKEEISFDRPGLQVLLLEPARYVIVRVTDLETLDQLAADVHEQGGFCGGLQRLGTQEISRVQAPNPEPLRSLRADPTIANQVDQVSREKIVETVRLLESWQTRHHQDSNGKFTAERLAELYSELIPADRSDVVVELVEHQGSSQKSLRVKVLGQTQPTQVYILGSHLDSINPRDNKNAPGADDNASGTATNLEIFRQLMLAGSRLDKTLEIHAYGAEEIGLVGSQEIAEDYRAQKVAVQAMIQFDMNGYTRDRAQFHFVSNSTNRPLSDSLAKLVDLYIGLPWQHSRLMYGSSDHASWHKMGFAVAFPTENPLGFNRKIHTAEDTLGNINSPEQMRAFAQLGLAFVLHYLSQDPGAL